MWCPTVGERAVVSGSAKKWRELRMRYTERDALNGTVVRIVRETPTLLIDDAGRKWRKADVEGMGEHAGYRLSHIVSLADREWYRLRDHVHKNLDVYRHNEPENRAALARGIMDMCAEFLARAEELSAT